MTFSIPHLPSHQIATILYEPITPYPIPKVEQQWSKRWRRIQQIVGILVFIGIIFSCTDGLGLFGSWSSASAIGFIIVFITSISVFLLILAALIDIPAALRATRISGHIAAERVRGTYDLLSISKLGAYGLHWWIGQTLSIQPMNLRYSQHRPLWQVFTLWILAFIGILFIIGFLQALPRDPLGTLRAGTYVLTTLYAIWLYLRQNGAVAALIGMLIPTYVEKRFEAQFWAFSAYILYQIGTIGLLVVVGFYLVPTQGGRWGSPSVGDVVVILLRMTLLIGSRELLIVWMYRRLRVQLRAHNSDHDLLYRLRFSYQSHAPQARSLEMEINT